ncbi:hypothetical protein T261_8120 [Streptomyces lydicus]|nr:hypothetical protein T261_8120 [Streptomyces lydicus]
MGDANVGSASSSSRGSDGERQSEQSPAGFRSGTAKQNKARLKTGGWANTPGRPATTPTAKKWVQLSAGEAGSSSTE